MRNYLIIIFIISIDLSCMSQQVTREIPIHSVDILDAPSGSYIKDTKNTFAFYLGNWVGKWDNKKLTITILKEERVLFTNYNGTYKFRDIMYGKYQVSDEDGNVLEDNMSIEKHDEAKLMSFGSGPVKDAVSFFFFSL